MDRQTRFQSDPIAAPLLACYVLVRGAAAFDLHASLSLAAPAASAGDLDLQGTQAARAPAWTGTAEARKRTPKGCGPKVLSVFLRRVARATRPPRPAPSSVL